MSTHDDCYLIVQQNHIGFYYFTLSVLYYHLRLIYPSVFL